MLCDLPTTSFVVLSAFIDGQEKEDRSGCVHAGEDHRPAADSSRRTSSKQGRSPTGAPSPERGFGSPSLAAGSLLLVASPPKSREGRASLDRHHPLLPLLWRSEETTAIAEPAAVAAQQCREDGGTHMPPESTCCPLMSSPCRSAPPLLLVEEGGK
nr:hypothetical protein Iba_chr13bCG13480 [Ipomoea batatas]